MRLHVWGVQPRVINYSSTRPTKECMQEKEGFLFVLARSIVRGMRKKTDEIVRSFIRFGREYVMRVKKHREAILQFLVPLF